MKPTAPSTIVKIKLFTCGLFIALLSIITQAVYAAPIIDHWDVIQDAFFNNQKVIDAQNQITLQAPTQAENPAIVPFSFQVNLTQGHIDKIYVFTDANPILLTVTFSVKAPQTDFNVSTRIRLENNTVVRVIVLTTTGKLLMKTIGIKTPGGGCGGGAMSDEAKLRASAGKMRMRLSKPNPDQTHFASLHIKHPMRTGFERTFQGYYAKAWFIKDISFIIDHTPYFNAILGPGISADPYFKFNIPEKTNDLIQVDLTDNEGKSFQQTFNGTP